jgi:predicted dehydrogenase
MYQNYKDVLKCKGPGAICVASVTTDAEQTIEAIEAGMHVFGKKLLSTDIAVVP